MDKIEVLKRSDVFRELNDEQLGTLADMCVAETMGPGEIIHRQNTVLDKLRVIEEGLVAIVLETGPLSRCQVTAATNFETIGWSALVPPYLATTTTRTVEKTKMLTFNGHELLEYARRMGISAVLFIAASLEW
jgi:CRP-like cAMP-binding protein